MKKSTDTKCERVKPVPGQLPVNQETLDILVANIIPTSKYFEIRFDHLEEHFNRMQTDTEERFNRMQGDFEQRFNRMQDDIGDFKSDVDKRFEQVDKRFEQVDKRFDRLDDKMDRILDKLDQRDDKQRSFTLRMFTLSITISILGVTGAFLKSLGLI